MSHFIVESCFFTWRITFEAWWYRNILKRFSLDHPVLYSIIIYFLLEFELLIINTLILYKKDIEISKFVQATAKLFSLLNFVIYLPINYFITFVY